MASGRLARAMAAIDARFATESRDTPCADSVISAKTQPFGSFDTIGAPPRCVHGNAPEVAADAAPTPFAPGELGDWQRCLSRLQTGEPPCPGFRHWPSVHRIAMQFLHDRGEEAVRFGWGVLDLFGVHDRAGAVRVDCTGALITLRGKRVAELTPDLIRFADGLAYRRRPMSAGQSIPVWSFGGSSC